jgi:hypothetical protein
MSIAALLSSSREKLDGRCNQCIRLIGCALGLVGIELMKKKLNFDYIVRIFSCGIKWAVAFIIFYQILFATTYRFTPGASQHFYVSRDHSLINVEERIMILIADYPVALGSMALKWEFDDPFLSLLIYVPYFTSIQYFIFGCLFGLCVHIYKLKRKPPEQLR